MWSVAGDDGHKRNNAGIIAYHRIIGHSPARGEFMNEGKIDNDKAPESNTAVTGSAAAIAQHTNWLRLAGLVALGAAGSVTLALGATCFQLSQALIRPRLKRLSRLKSPHLRPLLKRCHIHVEDVTLASFDG